VSLSHDGKSDSELSSSITATFFRFRVLLVISSTSCRRMSGKEWSEDELMISNLKFKAHPFPAF
jgi:hypothetical protein